VLVVFSEEDGCLICCFVIFVLCVVGEVVVDWMCEVGMIVGCDAIGNVVGCLEGDEFEMLLMGLYLDSVRDVGCYDGLFGVFVVIVCVQWLCDEGCVLFFVLEVFVFVDEEGVCYGIVYFGSGVVVGCFDPVVFGCCDVDGIVMVDVIVVFGGDVVVLLVVCCDFVGLFGYVEVYIE